MDVRAKLSAFVEVPEEISKHCQGGSEDLSRDVEAGLDESEDHAGGKDDAPGEGLQQDVDPESGVHGFGADRRAFGNVFVAAVSESMLGEEDYREEESGSSAECGHDGGGNSEMFLRPVVEKGEDGRE
jgi:hypothetical protein